MMEPKIGSIYECLPGMRARKITAINDRKIFSHCIPKIPFDYQSCRKYRHFKEIVIREISEEEALALPISRCGACNKVYSNIYSHFGEGILRRNICSYQCSVKWYSQYIIWGNKTFENFSFMNALFFPVDGILETAFDIKIIVETSEVTSTSQDGVERHHQLSNIYLEYNLETKELTQISLSKTDKLTSDPAPLKEFLEEVLENIPDN